jgi:eukaryotic-like serine/threonine-protein kinase
MVWVKLSRVTVSFQLARGTFAIAHMVLSVGDKLGPYEIVAPIGAGGMGEVYKATDSRLGRTVSIKVSAAQFSERFEREARAIAALNHPNICTLYDVGPNYLVMEFIEGTPLHGPLPLEQALRYATQICDALDAAHKKDITHRDLKPSNILVTSDGRIKVLDFGVAKVGTVGAPSASDATEAAAQRMAFTEAGAVLGTAAYMSPEQAKGQEVDPRSDIFSFGLVLYELLTGRQAFARGSAVEVMAAIVRDAPAPLEAPSNLSAIVGGCLRKLRADRFQTIREVRAALQQIAETVTPATSTASASIAVLPFVNMSADAGDEYFSDGLAEEIINALVKVPGLRVIARTSAFAFKGQNTDIRRIAEALGVTNILEGSVRKAGNRIRVTAQLIAATDGSHLWSERYDRELADVFAVQDEIAAAIAGALQVKLSSAPRKHTPKLAAYEEFLKARHYLQKWAPGSVARARECLERAIALDPGFAQAHSELGWCFFTLVTENQILPQEAADSMRTEARKALEIDPSLADAQAVLGMAGVLDYDWTEAARHFQLAMACEPIQPLVRYFYSNYFLAPLGRMKEAEEESERGLQADPLNLLLRSVAGIYHVAAGRVSEGQAMLRQLLELDDTFWIAYGWLAASCALEERTDEAIAYVEKARALAPWNPPMNGMLAGVLERKGEKDRAQALLKELGDGSGFGAPGGFMSYHALLGQIDLACDWFEKVIEQRDTRAPWIFPHFFGDLITSNPRWPKLARRMNLPDGV